MTPKDFSLLESWFEAASTAEPEERERILAEAEAAGPAVAGELRRMLAAHDAEVTGEAHWTEPAPTWTPRAFGPWTAIRKIGQGGMGTVFLAHRADGQYEREVALKVLAAHLVDETFQNRFLAERRILAALSHPNIAHMLDAGVAEDGTPYLVIEYVDGEEISGYCDRRGMKIEDRARLFLQICSAVSYAHQRLILHRDLKPSNILVTRDGQVRLLDFGAAKLLGGDAAGFTVTGATLMTPRYASPEQMRQQPVGTQSDVYSLGVILFELLSGTGPFGEAGTPLAEFLRLAEQRSASALGEKLGPEAAARRGTTEAHLRRALAGDLRQIAAKCLHNDPEDRYGSVEALAGDVAAWLDQRPISARPPSLAYVAARFASRNWGKLSLAALVALAVGAGVTGTVWQKRMAEKHFNEVRSLARYQMFELFDGLASFAGTGELREQLVERSMSYLDSLSRDAGSNASLREELAEGYLRLGDLFANGGIAVPDRNEKARQAYAKGRGIIGNVTTASARRTLAMIELNAGTMTVNAPKDKVAAGEREALAAVEAAIAAAPAEPRNYLYLGNVLSLAGEKLSSAGGMLDVSQPGLPNFDRALAAYQKALELGGHAPEIKRMIWELYSRHAFVLSSSDPPRAIEISNKALAEIERETAGSRRDARLIRMQASLQSHVGWAAGQLLNYDLSIAANRRSANLLESLLADEPANIRLLYDLSSSYRALGIVEGYARKNRDAMASFEKAIAFHTKILEAGPSTQSEFLRAELEGRFSNLARVAGDSVRALESARRSEAALRKLCAVPNPNPIHLTQLSDLLATNPAVANPGDAVRFARMSRKLRPGFMADEALIQALIQHGELDEASQLLAPIEESARKSATGGETRFLQVVRVLRTALEDKRKAMRR